jgi:hypothetical protein
MAAVPEEIRATGLETSTYVAETAAGGAAVILAILGLAHTYPPLMAAVATVAAGLAVMFAGASVSAGYRRLLFATGERPLEVGQLGGGMSAEIIAGGAGIVLGVLALLDIAPLVLSSVAVIVYGSALLFGRGAATRLKDLEIETVEKRQTVQRVAEEAVATAMGAQTLVGLGAVVLGILALVGIQSLILTLIALLILGAGIVVGATTFSTNLLSTTSSRG